MEPSPFSSLLGTNNRPSLADYNEIQRVVSAKRSENAVLVVEIERTKAALLAMETRLAANQKFIQEQAPLMSPIRRIPADVLSTIFCLCLDYHSITSHEHPSMRISHVCKMWREVAFETRRLWAGINISLPGNELRSTAEDSKETYARWAGQIARIEKAFRAWAKRSAPYPLSMNLTVKLLFDTISEHRACFMTSYKALLDMILQSSARWRKFRAYLPLGLSTLPAATLLRIPPTALPMLKASSIEIVMGEYGVDTEQLFKQIRLGGLLTGPSVRSAALYNIAGNILYTNTSSAIPQWQTLTELRTSTLPARLAHELLCALPNLVNFSMELENGEYGDSAENSEDDEDDPAVEPTHRELDPITLPNLRTLRLTGYPVSQGFFRRFNIPCLDTLSLDYFDLSSSYRPLSEKKSGIVELTARFGHQLKSWSIAPGIITNSALRVCLQHLPNVVELKLSPLYYRDSAEDCEDANVSALSMLSIATQESNGSGLPMPNVLCPKLKRLETTGQNERPDSTTERVLVEFISGRRGGICGELEEDTASAPGFIRLQEVDIEFCKAPKIDIWKRLRELQVDLHGFNAYFRSVYDD